MTAVVDLCDSPPAQVEHVDLTQDSSDARKGGGAGSTTHDAHRAGQARAGSEKGAAQDMARDAGENAARGSFLLECKKVLLVLPSKATVAGTLHLKGVMLEFKPEQADALCPRGTCVDCSRVTGIQQSKPGSAKPRIKLIGGCGDGGGGESTFEFSQATNGSAWRDTLKDAVAAIMRARQEHASAPTAAASGCAVDGSSHRGTGGSQQEGKAGCERGQPGGPAEAVEGAAGAAQVYRLDAAAIYKFMTEYPNLMTVYQRVVPHQMSEHDFWRGFLEARNFHQGSDRSLAFLCFSLLFSVQAIYSHRSTRKRAISTPQGAVRGGAWCAGNGTASARPCMCYSHR